MDDTTEQPAAPESTAAPEAAEPSEQVEQTSEVGLLSEGSTEVETEQVDDDSEELEYEGRKFKAPAAVRDALLRHADYTRKTQAVAEQQRAIEHHAAEVQRQAAFHQENIAEVARVVSIDDRLRQFQQLDWDGLTKADPVQAMTLERQMRNLQTERQQIAQSIAQKQQAMTFQQQQFAARRLEEGRRELARDIKGWSPELASKLMQTAKGVGFRDEELAGVSDSRTVKLLHKAYLYDQLVAKQSAKAPATQAPPVTRIAPKASTAITDPDKLPADEWRRLRDNQIAERNRKR
jgi:hypothetical protein